MKKRRRGHRHYSGRHGDNPEELAARLAPPEERAAQAGGANGGGNGGAIVVDTARLQLPKGLREGDGQGPKWFGVEPVVLVIVGLMLLFIIFIAWQISGMERPAG